MVCQRFVMFLFIILYHYFLFNAYGNELTKQWTFDVKKWVQTGMVMKDDKLFFGANDGNLYKLDAGSGKEIWRVPCGKPLTSRPVIFENTIVVADAKGKVYAIDISNGKEVWYNEFVGKKVRPVFYKEFIVANNKTTVSAFDVKNGRKKWDYNHAGKITTNVFVMDNLVFFGDAEGFILGIDLLTGHKKWSFSGGPPVLSVAAADGKLFYYEKERFLNCIDISKKVKLWDYKFGGEIGFLKIPVPLIKDGLLFYGFDSLYAIDIHNGVPEKIYRGSVLGNPSIEDNMVAYITYSILKTGIKIWDSEKHLELVDVNPGGVAGPAAEVLLHGDRLYYVSTDMAGRSSIIAYKIPGIPQKEKIPSVAAGNESPIEGSEAVISGGDTIHEPYSDTSIEGHSDEDTATISDVESSSDVMTQPAATIDTTPNEDEMRSKDEAPLFKDNGPITNAAIVFGFGFLGPPVTDYLTGSFGLSINELRFAHIKFAYLPGYGSSRVKDSDKPFEFKQGIDASLEFPIQLLRYRHPASVALFKKHVGNWDITYYKHAGWIWKHLSLVPTIGFHYYSAAINDVGMLNYAHSGLMLEYTNNITATKGDIGKKYRRAGHVALQALYMISAENEENFEFADSGKIRSRWGGLIEWKTNLWANSIFDFTAGFGFSFYLGEILPCFLYVRFTRDIYLPF